LENTNILWAKVGIKEINIMRIAFVKIVSVSQNALYFGNNKEKYQGFYFMHSID